MKIFSILDIEGSSVEVICSSNNQCIPNNTNEYMTQPKLFYSSIDRIKFHNLLDQEIILNVKLKTYKDFDNTVDKFTSIISTAAWATQFKTTTTNSKNLLLPIHLRSLITDKMRARARFITIIFVLILNSYLIYYFSYYNLKCVLISFYKIK